MVEIVGSSTKRVAGAVEVLVAGASFNAGAGGKVSLTAGVGNGLESSDKTGTSSGATSRVTSAASGTDEGAGILAKDFAGAGIAAGFLSKNSDCGAFVLEAFGIIVSEGVRRGAEQEA
jgi:hypothetical protein